MNKIINSICTLLIGFSVSLPIYSDGVKSQAEANAIMARVSHQLDMVKILLNQAAEVAPKNSREIIHYNWMIRDIGNIQNGINETINQTNLAPRAIQPIDGDYLEAPAIKVSKADE